VSRRPGLPLAAEEAAPLGVAVQPRRFVHGPAGQDAARAFAAALPVALVAGSSTGCPQGGVAYAPAAVLAVAWYRRGAARRSAPVGS
jgi:hypothetical protein